MAKRKIFTAILLIFAVACLVFGLVLSFGYGLLADAGPVENNHLKIETLDDKSDVLNNGYLDRYGVPTSKFTYENNGDAEDGAPLSYAFDRNFNSVWRSRMQTVDTGTINRVTVTFSSPMLIDRIVYQADSSWYDRGYFNTLTLSYVNENGQSVSCDAISSAQTNAIVLVTLKDPATVKKITLEWTKVPTNHRTVAAASEIIFLQPHSADVENVQNMFTDYAQLTLDKTKVNSKEDVARLRGKVQKYASYDTELSYLLNRAEQVLDGTVFYEPRREMGTAASSSNVILQHGDVAGYARSTLKYAWFGTNRQATGVSASPGEDLIVYVTGEESDPLPSIVFSQHWGSWRSWKSGEFKLRLGKNVIKIGNYLQDGYTDNTGDALAPGGPVYLVNPYTSQTQSASVKVYFEGGDLFPIFREGDNESAYKKRLADYATDVARDREENADTKAYKVVDVTEIVSDRVIVTVEASMADALYNAQSYSPQAATENWDKYVDGILQFDGVVLENNAQKLQEVGAKYDERNQWLNVNIRLAQPYGAAYAYTEHIGIQVSWEAAAITGGPGFGWGYTHEIGHMLDIGERTVSECSNNMVSKYHETVIELTAQRGDFQKTTDALAPDSHISSYWNTNRGNFIFWWLIESYWPGYWARLDNLYRYEDVFQGFSDEEKKALGSMNATEKQVYLSSLVVKEDLSYYFERWGYNLGTNDYIFEADGANTSKAFKAVMKKAKEDGRILTGTQPKLWYLDAAEWWARYPDKTSSELYDGDELPYIKTITKSGDGYNLIMDVEGASDAAHLGFEISEGSSGTWKVVGFTYDKMFLDPADYGNRTPKYRVVAYDRALHASAVSQEKSPSTGEDEICELGGKKYGSLYEAVAAAKNGGVITLLKDTSETGIVIDKDITVRLNTSCTVTKGGPQPIFTVVERKDEEGNVLASGKLTLTGSASATLTLDGGNISTNNPLVLVQGGAFTADRCAFQNNAVRNAANAYGGGLRIDGGKISLTDCSFKGNTARYGGAVYITNTHGDLTERTADAVFVRCAFSANTATEGGAVYNRGTAKFTDCSFLSNEAESVGGGSANMLGGVVYFHGCTWDKNAAARGGALYADGMAMIFGGAMSENSARENGAAICYARSSTGARPFYALDGEGTGSTLTITENVCEEGAAVYLYGETASFKADVHSNDTKYAVWLGGRSAVLSGGRIGGTLFKEKDTPVSVKSEVPAPFSSTILVETDSEEASLLLFTSDFDLTEGDAALFETLRGSVLLGGKREIRLEMEAYTVTLKIGQEEETHKYLPGHKFTLGALGGDYAQRTYIARWLDSEGMTYEVGAEVTVEHDMTLTAETAQKFTVTFSVDPAAELGDITYYVMPSEEFDLPKIDPEKYVFGGWSFENALFQAYETVSVNADRTYEARLTKKLSVSYAVRKDGEDVVYATRYYPYGSKIQFVSCHDESLVPSGGYINGFFAKNADGTYASDFIDFDTYTAQNDNIWLLADVVDMPVYVMYSFTEDGAGFVDGADTVTDLAPFGSDYTIALRAIPTGYHIVSLQLFTSTENLTFDRSELDGFKLTLTEMYYIINADLTRDIHNITYQINGAFYRTETKKYGDTLKLDDPTDTILKDAFPDGTNYSFSSYQLVTKDPMMGLEDLGGTTEMNVRLGDEITVTEDMTVNMIVYVEGQERAPEAEPAPDDGAAQELLMKKAERKAAMQERANTFLNELNADTGLSAEERSEYIARVERALSDANAAVDASTTPAEADSAYDGFAAALESIREELLRQEGVVVEVTVSGLTAKTKTYDGTSDVEIDLSNVVFLNAATGLVIDAEYSKDFRLNVEAHLSDKNAGVRAAELTITLTGGGEYYRLAEGSKQVTLMVEIKRAKLTISLDEDLNPVYEGFVGGEDESVLSGEITVVYSDEDGTRTATPGGVTSENYDITFVGRPVESGDLGLILGIAIPVAVVLLAGAAALVLVLRKKKK